MHRLSKVQQNQEQIAGVTIYQYNTNIKSKIVYKIQTYWHDKEGEVILYYLMKLVHTVRTVPIRVSDEELGTVYDMEDAGIETSTGLRFGIIRWLNHWEVVGYRKVNNTNQKTMSAVIMQQFQMDGGKLWEDAPSNYTMRTDDEDVILIEKSSKAPVFNGDGGKSWELDLMTTLPVTQQEQLVKEIKRAPSGSSRFTLRKGIWKRRTDEQGLWPMNEWEDHPYCCSQKFINKMVYCQEEPIPRWEVKYPYCRQESESTPGNQCAIVRTNNRWAQIPAEEGRDSINTIWDLRQTGAIYEAGGFYTARWVLPDDKDPKIVSQRGNRNGMWIEDTIPMTREKCSVYDLIIGCPVGQWGRSLKCRAVRIMHQGTDSWYVVRYDSRNVYMKRHDNAKIDIKLATRASVIIDNGMVKYPSKISHRITIIKERIYEYVEGDYLITMNGVIMDLAGRSVDEGLAMARMKRKDIMGLFNRGIEERVPLTWETRKRKIQGDYYVVNTGSASVSYSCEEIKRYTINDRRIFGKRMQETPVFIEENRWQVIGKITAVKARIAMMIVMTRHMVDAKKMTKEQGSKMIEDYARKIAYWIGQGVTPDLIFQQHHQLERLIVMGMLRVQWTGEKQYVLDEQNNVVVEKGTYRPPPISTHQDKKVIYINSKISTLKIDVAVAYRIPNIMHELIKREMTSQHKYVKMVETTLPHDKETSALYEAIASITTYIMRTSQVIARYGKWIQENMQSIASLNMKIGVMDIQVKQNTKDIRESEVRMDKMGKLLEDQSHRIDHLEKRMDKYEKNNMGKIGRVLSSLGKGVEKVANGIVDGAGKLIDKIGDNVAKVEDHGGDAIAKAFTPLMIGGIAIGCAVVISGGIAMAVKLKISSNKVKMRDGMTMGEINIVSLEQTLGNIGRQKTLMIILKAGWCGVLLAGFSLLIAEILNDDQDVATIFVCIVIAIQFVGTSMVLILNRKRIGMTVCALDEFNEEQVVRIKMAWKATSMQILKWLGYWLMLIIPSIVLLLQEIEVFDLNSMDKGNVKDWWKFAIIGWGILATLYVTSRGRTLFVKKGNQWTEINALTMEKPEEPENEERETETGDDDENIRLKKVLTRVVSFSKRAENTVFVSVATFLWLTSLILVSYGAAKRHYTIHLMGSLIAMFLALLTTIGYTLCGDSKLAQLARKRLFGRTSEPGETINLMEMEATAPPSYTKHTREERNEMRRQRIEKEIEEFKRNIINIQRKMVETAHALARGFGMLTPKRAF